MPLLDGLDQVRSADRAACLTAINTFGQEYSLAGLAVCSRLAEYTALPIRPQPLSTAQVGEYLAHLRQVGGGYIFIHRLLLEHFAELAPEPETQRCSFDQYSKIVFY